MYPKDYLEIIQEICDKYSIQTTAFDNTSVLRLVYDGEQHFIWSRRFDLNSAISSRLADNKYETVMVLQSSDIPAVSCRKLFRPDLEEYTNSHDCSYRICNELLKEYHAIVVKPNNSYEGKCVFKCSTMHDVESAIYAISSAHSVMVVSPYIEATCEFRVIVLNGTAMLVYKKERPFIVADGKSTIYELLVAQSYDFSYIDDTLYKDLGKIYPDGKKIMINWKFNLSQGAHCQIVKNSEMISKLSALAVAAANAIGITFATVDILEDKDGRLSVLEINAGVAMDQFIQQIPDGRKIATGIYEKAILSMFHMAS